MTGLLRRIAKTIRRPDVESRAQVAAVPGSHGEDALRLAIEHHNAGRLADAQACYERVLAGQPGEFVALHRLGALHYERGETDRAISYIRRAIDVRPEDAAAHGNLGAAYLALGQLDTAEESLLCSLALRPESDITCNILGALRRARDDIAGAATYFERALALNPRNAEAANNLGNLAKESGDLERAEAYYAQALALNPDFPDAYSNLGSVHQQRGDFAKAEQHFLRALALRPDSAEALNNLGGVRQDRGELDSAEECFRAALRLQPDLAPAIQNLGHVLRLQGRLEEAERHCRRAIELDPASASAWSNLATVVGQRGDLHAAEALCRNAIGLDRTCIAAHCNLGSVLRQQARMPEAEASYREALKLDPASDHTRYDLAILALLQGSYAEGLELYESRFRCRTPEFAATRDSHAKAAGVPAWRGEPLAGKRIYVWSEQGLGDALMVMRYLPLLQARGAAVVTVQCDATLVRVMRAMGVDDVVTEISPVARDRFDMQCSMMSLPFLFGTRSETIPNAVPYLDVPPDLCASWSARLAGVSRPRIGVAWAGNRTLSDDARRSIRLTEFAPLLRRRDVRWISLQKGEGAAQWDQASREPSPFIDACNDFMDTAGLIANLDLVVTVDTAVAHLAGALGRRVYLLNRFGSEWRWGLEREDSPWYPTLRQFRQRRPGEWSDVIARVGQALDDELRVSS
jgi:tetratricopeptide (TPR) repeat protein